MSEAAEIPDEVLNDAPLPDANEPDAELSAEDRALAMGWTPRSQFKGDPDKFVDADEYIRKGEEFLPLLKANNRKLEQEVQKANRRAEKLEKTLERFAQHHSKTEQRALAKAKADLEAELEQYAAAGNTAAVKAVTKDMLDLEREAAGQARDETPATDPSFEAWREANEWFGTDKALTAATEALAQEVFDEGYTGKAQLKEVDRRLREQFPAKFEKPVNPNRRLAGAVEGSGAARRSNGKGYSDLPAEARAVCDDFVKRIPGFTREKYCKDFFQ